MRRCAVVVEGQSEAVFVDRVLNPLAWSREAYLTPIIVPTSSTPTRTHKGGGSSWEHYRNILLRLCHQPQWDSIGVMLDLYGCPRNTPGLDTSLPGPQQREAIQRAVLNELSKSQTPRVDRVKIGPILYEFETLVIAAIATGRTTASPTITKLAQQAIHDCGGTEAVNGAAATAPSKRMEQWWQHKYQKSLHGPDLIAEVPWQDVADQCPSFSDWLDELLGD